jgi:hypothetical protein
MESSWKRRAAQPLQGASTGIMIRKLKSGQYRLYSRKKEAATGKRRNLGTFKTLEAAKQHEKEVQYFKHHSQTGELSALRSDSI